MRTSTLVFASILAVVVSAQDIPASCTRVVGLVQQCVPSDATEDDLTGPGIADCLCSGDDSFDNDVVDCITAAGQVLPADAQAALEAFRGYCSQNSGGGTGGGNTGSPTQPSETSGPSETSEPTSAPTGGSENCNYVVAGISSCWTDNNPLPTAAPVARCLCDGTSFDAAIEGCYSDLVDASPKDASTIAAFAGFCSSYSAGAFESGSSPTTSDEDSSSPSTDAVDATDAPTTTGRVIQTLDPAATTTSASNSNNNNGGGNGPNSAAGLQITILGTAFAALLAGAALIL